MFKKIVRVLGLIFIISFSVVNVILYNSNLKKDWSAITLAQHPLLSGILELQSFFEDRFYDMRTKLSQNRVKAIQQQDPRIVLAAIDDLSLKHLGRFPWTRGTWTPVLEKLKKFGAKVVAFDVVFAEPEKSCESITPDQQLSSAFKSFQEGGEQKIILSYSLTYDGDTEKAAKEVPENLYNFVLDTKQSGDSNVLAKKVDYTSYPLPILLEAGIGVGFIGASEDMDGIFRHYPIVANVDSIYFPSIALLSYQYYSKDVPQLIINSNETYLQVKSGKLFLDKNGETKIRWKGTSYTYPIKPIHEIIKAKDDDPEMIKTFKDRIVYIGSTAFGAHDLRHTPVDPQMPGVYYHMNIASMLLDGNFHQPMEKSLAWSWGILILGTLLMILVSLFKNAIVDVVFLLAICGGIFYLDTYTLVPKGYQVTLFFSLFPIICTYFWNTLINFYCANKDKQFLKNAFGNYISPELIDEMHKSGEPPKLGGNVGTLTAYFTDIQGFSTFSEKLSAPQLVELLNEYLTVMTDILLELRGTLDKYEGDAIIAFFGAPLPLPEHAIHACKVALKMQSALADLRGKWTGEGNKWPVFVHSMRMRIGINSGQIVTGNMGSRSRMNYTMMGDSVNLAARLEAAAKQYGVFVQVSQFTKALTNDQFEMRELDTIKVVGKSEPVTTYDLLGEKGNTSPDLLKLQKLFHQGIVLYKQQQWDQAITTFQQSLEYEHKRFPELKGKINPSLVYIERCQEFKNNPPSADWDGVYTLTSK